MPQAHDDGRDKDRARDRKQVLIPPQTAMHKEDGPPFLPAAMAVFVLRPLRRELCAAVCPPGPAPPRPVALVTDAVVDLLGSELTAAISAPSDATSIPPKVARG